VINYALSAVSGILAILIFPKFNLYLFAYVALVPLILAVKQTKTPKDAGVNGFIFGLVLFLGTLFWINTLATWAGAWAYAAWVALAIFQALFYSAFAYIYRYSIDRYPGYDIISAPFIWAVLEWVRSFGPFGVTGGGLSYSQTDLLPILQIVRYTGPYFISFVIVMFNVSLVSFIKDKNWKYPAFSLFLVLLLCTFGYYKIASYKDSGRPIKIAIVQPNVAQDVKMDFGLAYQIVETHTLISRKAMTLKPQLIIWPETAVTTYLLETRSILSQVTDLVKESRIPYLIGTPYRERENIYNSVIAFGGDGKIIGRYDKQRPVPFGEYLPLRPLLERFFEGNSLFLEDYSFGPKAKILDLGFAKAGVVICFESTFPYFVRDRVKKGAQFIVIVTNDAWFFDSAALYQHIAAAKMRAIENGVYVVQAANTGISAIIDPLGRTVKKTDEGEVAVLSGDIYVH
jgi:apolipoprotein N-acyltransferase